jgi:hypothetical protein
MIATSWGVVLILAQSVCGGHGHEPSGPGFCDICGVETAAVTDQIIRMQKSPNWRARDNAAHALRKFDWRCHPEVVEALAFTLLHDDEEEVREEAAQSLTKMTSCLAVAHEALNRAANCDPDHSTRRWARKGLRALGGRCEGTCKVCSPEVIGPVIPLPAGRESVISGPTIVPGEVPKPEPVFTPTPAPPPEATSVPPVPPSGLPSLVAPGETPAPPIDSRVEPPPTELSPLPPPATRPSASSEADKGSEPEKKPAREPTLARGRSRRLPFGVRLPSVFSRR